MRLYFINVVRGQQVQVLRLARLLISYELLHHLRALRLSQAVDTIFATELIFVFPTIDQIMQVRVEVLHLLPELLNVLSSVFSFVRAIRLLTSAVIILLCYLVKHADLTIQLLDRLLARSSRRLRCRLL